MRVAVGALGAVKTLHAGSIAYTGWDASVDAEATDITDFTGQSIIDRNVRADAVENAKRADAFNERVMSEVQRLSAERAAEVEQSAEERISEFEQAAVQSEQRAREAEREQLAAASEAEALRQEGEILQAVINGSRLTSEEVAAIRKTASEKLVLPDSSEPTIVGDVEDSSSDTNTVRSEERKA